MYWRQLVQPLPSAESEAVYGVLRSYPRTFDLLVRLEESVPGGFLVGGSVRDSLLGYGIEPKDLDVMCSPAILERLRSEGFPGGSVGANRHGNVRITVSGYHIDVFSPDSFFGGFHSLEEALSNFDVNISALAWPLSGGPVIDPLKALPYLKRGEIELVQNRWIGEPEAMERAVLRARLLKLLRRFPYLRCMNSELAMPDVKKLFDEFPEIVKHHVGHQVHGAANELIARLEQS